MINLNKTKMALAIIGAMTLTACGGGGSSGNGGKEENTPEVEKTSVELQVIDGYLVNSFVFVDLNNNYQFDQDEPNGYADEKGKVKIEIENSKLTNNRHLKVFAQSKKGSKNVILGKEKELSKNVALSTSIFINNGGVEHNPIISPYTTLITSKISNKQNLSKETFDALLSEVAKSLGLKIDIITKDYNDESLVKDNDDMLKALVTGEILVRNDVISSDLDNQKDTAEQGASSDTTTEIKTEEIVKEIDSEVSDFSEIINEVVNDPEIAEKISDPEAGDLGELVNEKIEKAVVKLGASFKSLSGEEADEYRCGVTNSNNVFCWGNNSVGTLGNPDAYKDESGNYITDGYNKVDLFSAKPTSVMLEDGKTALSNVKKVATGNGHACALTYDGNVYCWGQNYHGQIGTGTIDKSLPIIPYASKVVKGHQNKDNDEFTYLTNIKDIVAAHNSVCAVTKDGEVFCWGDNSSMQLGSDFPGEDNIELWKDVKSRDGISLYGFIKGVAYPVQVKFPDSLAKVNSIAGGIWAYCALADNKDTTDLHNLYCWGNDIRGLVTQNWKQYLEDFEEKYDGKLYVRDQSRLVSKDSNWEWTIYEDDGEWYPLYGAPARQIREFSGVLDSFNRIFPLDTPNLPSLDASLEEWLEFDPTGFTRVYNDMCGNLHDNQKCVLDVFDGEYDDVEGVYRQVRVELLGNLDLQNITTFKLRDFDSTPTFIMNDDSKVYGFYNGGTEDTTSFWTQVSSLDTNNEKIVNIYTNVEGAPSFVLTNAGKLYSFISHNSYGMLGIGNYENYAFEYDCVQVDSDKCVTRIKNLPVVQDENGLALTNIVDVSLNKRSVCAAQKTIDSADNDKVNYKLYCWGSSTFGQLGFDDNDGGYSYNDTSKLWTGYSDDNAEFDKPSRMIATPREIDFFDKE